MFSENEIIIHCRQCQGDCDHIKKCPLKIEWSNSRRSNLFPVMPGNWKFSTPDQYVAIIESDKYTTEELISGLNKLNSHL